MKVASLFSGIGGLELPFQQAGHLTELLCDVWEPARKVLTARFPGVRLFGDVRDIPRLPPGVDLVTAGFPCTDLSQAGRTAGIRGQQSGLVDQVFRLLGSSPRANWLVLENVRNMLVLDRGEAMAYLTGNVEALGFRWAYRLVDSRFTGVPQRRQRVLFVACRDGEPRDVLFADDAGEPDPGRYRHDAYGFYWTEGLRGLGWAPDATPPLKGGSTVGIPSPPAVWLPHSEPGRKLVVPSITDAEQLQGFEAGWTVPAETDSRNGPRWKLVGNAVTVGVARWLVGRLDKPGKHDPSRERSLERGSPWPTAAWGDLGQLWAVEVSMWPTWHPYRHLTEVMDVEVAQPLSHRATVGFLDRASRAKLSVITVWIVMLWWVNQAIARAKNAAQVSPVSSGRISL